MSTNHLKRKRDELDHDHRGRTDESESEEEFDFENIDLDQVSSSDTNHGTDQASTRTAISLTLDPQTLGNSRQKYPTTAIARKIRFEIHKTHLLCLMSHVALRNKWCSDPGIAEALTAIRSKFRGNVHPKTTSAQIQRTRVLLEGLESLSDLWSKSFKMTARGSTKSKWYTEEDLPKILASHSLSGKETHKVDLVSGAKTMQGDRDMGAQLFVTLLRSLDLETRLVCSLQPLGLSVGKHNLATIIQEAHLPDTTTTADTPKTTTPQPRRLTRPTLGAPKRKPPVTRPKPQIKLAVPLVESPYPVWWAEVFDIAAQKWYPVDPLVTGTVNKPGDFEPPLSEPDNTLAYVVAFEEDGSARDVTHRYTRHFNAKVRRSRLEGVSVSGAAWWKRLMKFYGPKHRSDRDHIESSDLAQRELSEGIPANVTDLKNHPLFVIERHLHKNEIIDPKRECGTITIGKVRPPVIEKVYPRKFVHKLKSSLAWYMRGRHVRIGEQPLKMVEKRAQPVQQREELEEEDYPPTDDAHNEEGLYAEHQTDVYEPPPVVGGVVPKNAFGNIDLFTPTMVPAGATHVSDRHAEKAAQLLGIDYAVAVTGFDHANRQTVAVKQGVVVANESLEAMKLVLEVHREEAAQVIERNKTLTALTRWSHFLRSLRVREHVQSRYGRDEPSADEPADPIEYGDEQVDTGGGFM